MPSSNLRQRSVVALPKVRVGKKFTRDYRYEDKTLLRSEDGTQANCLALYRVEGRCMLQYSEFSAICSPTTPCIGP